MEDVRRSMHFPIHRSMELLVKLLKYLELIINYSSRKIVRDISILILSNIYREENKEEYILNFIFNEVKILVES